MNILIADDHGIVRSGLRLLLERQNDMKVVAEAEDGKEAVEKTLSERPDLVILDVGMPRMSGLAAAREIKERLPETEVLMLSMHDEEEYLFEALKAGASGYVLKRSADQDLLNACRAVQTGEPFLYPNAQKMLIQGYLRRPGDKPGADLTPRERQVVELIADAHTNKEIAEILGLSEKTVETHRQNLLKKLGMRDRVQLVRYAIRQGWITP